MQFSLGFNLVKSVLRVILDQWWTSESPRAHEAKRYGRLRIIRSVLRASQFSVLKLIEIVILWVYYTIPFDFSLFRHILGINFLLFKLLCLATDQ